MSHRHDFLLKSRWLCGFGMGLYGFCDDASRGVLLLGCFLRNNRYLCTLARTSSISHEAGESCPAERSSERVHFSPEEDTKLPEMSGRNSGGHICVLEI